MPPQYPGAPKPPQNTPVYIARNPWPLLISLSLGYFWLISGIDKILGGKFVPGFNQFITDLIQYSPSMPWVKGMLESKVLPHSEAMAMLIQYGELAIGVILIAASLQSFLKSTKFFYFLLAFMHAGGVILALTIILVQGLSFPFIDTNKVFEPGMNIDFVVLFVSLALVLVNLQEALRRK